MCKLPRYYGSQKSIHTSVTTSLTEFSLLKPGFLEFIWIFSRRNHFKNQYLPHSESKSYQIKFYLNLAHQDLSNNIKGKFQFLQNLQLWFKFFSEEIIQYSRTYGTKPMHAPLLLENFPKRPRTRAEASWFDGSHKYKTKQNKLPSFIDRL